MRSTPGRDPLPERVDVTIIGGGINGVALARQCAQAGKTVLLLERYDFASGTTSRGARIVPGGLRYLEQGAFGLLRESLQGRATLLREQPHLVQPLDFVFAAAPNSRYSALEVHIALWIYRKLGKVVRSTADVEALRRSLDPYQRWALYSYLDAQCDFPERLVADWLLEAIAAGAIARNHAEVISIRASEGRVRGVLVRDRLTAQDSYIESEWVINATGPWVDRVRDLTGLPARSPLAIAVRSSHLMLRRWPGAPTVGLHITTQTGRPLSIAPWNGMLQLGSTEATYSGDPSLATPTDGELQFLLTYAAALFPSSGLSSADVIFSYAGVRPVPRHEGEDPLRAARYPTSHVLHNHADDGALGMLSIFGGTLTTATALARQTSRTMGLRPPRAPRLEVANGEADVMENTMQHWSSTVHQVTGIPLQSAEAIARWHGRHAMCVVQTAMHDPLMRQPILDGQPQLVAQAAEAANFEQAVTLADILLRRVPMALDRDWNEYATIQAAARIAPALGWSERRMREEVEAFEEERARFLHKPGNLKPNGVAA